MVLGALGILKSGNIRKLLDLVKDRGGEVFDCLQMPIQENERIFCS